MGRILLIGCDGQVGQALGQTLLARGELITINRAMLDLSQSEQVQRFISALQPDMIVNAAAYTAVDRAEQEPELAYLINAQAPGLIAEVARDRGAKLIHISTDYVFDGQKSQPYLETDAPNPLGVYGQSKLAGEAAIQASGCASVILRTAWVYSAQAKQNFVKTMLRLGAEREEIRVVADQIGSPTWAKDIAHTIAELIPHLHSEDSQIYHYTNSGVASWYDFAVAIFEEARCLGLSLVVERVVPITTTDYPTPAQRPVYSVLAGNKIAQQLGHVAPHWRDSLRKMLTELTDEKSPSSRESGRN